MFTSHPLPRLLLSGLIVFVSLGASSPPRSPTATLPPDFADELLVTVGNGPTALAFTPDERLLITRQSGQLHVFKEGNLTTALDLSNVLCDDVERGLLGVAVDPNFASNQFIYLYYTFNKFNNSCPTGTGSTNPVNRLSRFVLPANNQVLTTSETVLIDNLASIWGNHNAGDVHFGADGLLYVSVGDGGAGGSNARVVTNLSGKMLRINPDGTIPASNPYAAAVDGRRCGDPAGIPSGSGPCFEVIAKGLRNPFRFAFRSGTNEFYINDVGQNAWEEIDVGELNADYGWNQREGPCRYDFGSSQTDCGVEPPGLTNPIFAYRHETGCYTITGGAFVPTGVWPEPYAGQYLFADYGCNKIFALTPLSTSYTSTVFASDLGTSNPVTMRFGPYNNTQALYYTTYWSDGGQVRRIVYGGNVNLAPSASLVVTPTFGDLPLQATFNASASADANGDPLTFAWDYGDGITATNSLSVTQHTYTVKGIYTATVIVRDDQGGASAPASAVINAGNTPPSPSIATPLSTTQFTVGQVITLTGSALDVEDGALPASALRWEVVLHHVDAANPGNAHIHPYLAPTAGTGLTLTTPPPEGLSAAALSYLEVRLTATDSWGRATIITQTLEPRHVILTFNTLPTGLSVLADHLPFTDTQTATSWAGYQLPLSAPSQTVNSQTWLGVGWSNGGAGEQVLTTPATNTVLTATFTLATNKIFLPLVNKP